MISLRALAREGHEIPLFFEKMSRFRDDLIATPIVGKVIDTTAAGDCFTAALAAEYLRSRDILEACRRGNAAGALAVQTLGAQGSAPTFEELTAFEKCAVR